MRCYSNKKCNMIQNEPVCAWSLLHKSLLKTIIKVPTPLLIRLVLPFMLRF